MIKTLSKFLLLPSLLSHSKDHVTCPHKIIAAIKSAHTTYQKRTQAIDEHTTDFITKSPRLIHYTKGGHLIWASRFLNQSSTQSILRRGLKWMLRQPTLYDADLMSQVHLAAAISWTFQGLETYAMAVDEKSGFVYFVITQKPIQIFHLVNSPEKIIESLDNDALDILTDQIRIFRFPINSIPKPEQSYKLNTARNMYPNGGITEINRTLIPRPGETLDDALIREESTTQISHYNFYIYLDKADNSYGMRLNMGVVLTGELKSEMMLPDTAYFKYDSVGAEPNYIVSRAVADNYDQLIMQLRSRNIPIPPPPPWYKP